MLQPPAPVVAKRDSAPKFPDRQTGPEIRAPRCFSHETREPIEHDRAGTFYRRTASSRAVRTKPLVSGKAVAQLHSHVRLMEALVRDSLADGRVA
jgi:hypothetical protein